MTNLEPLEALTKAAAELVLALRRLRDVASAAEDVLRSTGMVDVRHVVTGSLLVSTSDLQRLQYHLHRESES